MRGVGSVVLPPAPALFWPVRRQGVAQEDDDGNASVGHISANASQARCRWQADTDAGTDLQMPSRRVREGKTHAHKVRSQYDLTIEQDNELDAAQRETMEGLAA